MRSSTASGCGCGTAGVPAACARRRHHAPGKSAADELHRLLLNRGGSPAVRLNDLYPCHLHARRRRVVVDRGREVADVERGPRSASRRGPGRTGTSGRCLRYSSVRASFAPSVSVALSSDTARSPAHATEAASVSSSRAGRAIVSVLTGVLPSGHSYTRLTASFVVLPSKFEVPHGTLLRCPSSRSITSRSPSGICRCSTTPRCRSSRGERIVDHRPKRRGEVDAPADHRWRPDA